MGNLAAIRNTSRRGEGTRFVRAVEGSLLANCRRLVEKAQETEILRLLLLTDGYTSPVAVRLL